MKINYINSINEDFDDIDDDVETSDDELSNMITKEYWTTYLKNHPIHVVTFDVIDGTERHAYLTYIPTEDADIATDEYAIFGGGNLMHKGIIKCVPDIEHIHWQTYANGNNNDSFSLHWIEHNNGAIFDNTYSSPCNYYDSEHDRMLFDMCIECKDAERGKYIIAQTSISTNDGLPCIACARQSRRLEDFTRADSYLGVLNEEYKAKYNVAMQQRGWILKHPVYQISAFGEPFNQNSNLTNYIYFFLCKDTRSPKISHLSMTYWDNAILANGNIMFGDDNKYAKEAKELGLNPVIKRDTISALHSILWDNKSNLYIRITDWNDELSSALFLPFKDPHWIDVNGAGLKMCRVTRNGVGLILSGKAVADYIEDCCAFDNSDMPAVMPEINWHEFSHITRVIVNRWFGAQTQRVRIHPENNDPENTLFELFMEIDGPEFFIHWIPNSSYFPKSVIKEYGKNVIIMDKSLDDYNEKQKPLFLHEIYKVPEKFGTDCYTVLTNIKDVMQDWMINNVNMKFNYNN